MALPKTVAVVGAGNMGAGIAQKIAMEGFDVLLADMDLERATVGKGRIAKTLEQAVARRVLTEEAAQATLSRVTPVGDRTQIALGIAIRRSRGAAGHTRSARAYALHQGTSDTGT